MVDAGWFPDPHNPGQLRYWNGTTWTEHVNVPETVAAPPPFTHGQAPPPPMPMPRPQGNQINDIGEWIRETFKVAWKKLLPALALIGLGLLAFIPFVIVQIIALVNIGFVVDDAGVGSGTIVLFVVAGLLALAASIWFAVVSLALNYLYHQAHHGRTVTVSESLVVGRRHLWRYVGAYIVLVAIGLGILLVIGLIGAGLYVAVGEGALILLAFVYLAWIPTAMWLQVKLSFLSVVAAVAPPGTRLIRTSMDLSSGRFWPVLGRILLLGLIAGVAMMPLQMLSIVGFPVLFSTADPASGEPSATGLIAFFGLFAVVIVVAMVLTQLFTKSGIARLYRDLGGPITQ